MIPTPETDPDFWTRPAVNPEVYTGSGNMTAIHSEGPLLYRGYSAYNRETKIHYTWNGTWWETDES